MIIRFRVAQASKCPQKDVVEALDIYCKSVDANSFTDTNQIKEYIWNHRKHNTEKRKMFFFLLYDQDENVIGFSEFGYLPENKVLVLDYLCTKQRNHVLFYNFYHMVLQEITELLKSSGCYIRYILTELSTNQLDGRLIDEDSNYFRHLLSNESFRLLKYPYYQPPLFPHEDAQEFNIAIKSLSMESGHVSISQAQYLAIIRELFFSHYLRWYDNFLNTAKYKANIGKLLERIEKEIPSDIDSKSIAFIQCSLFEEGQCPKFTAENITIARQHKKKWKARASILVWTILSICTFALSVHPILSHISAVLCSFFTILAGIITVFSFRKEL